MLRTAGVAGLTLALAACGGGGGGAAPTSPTSPPITPGPTPVPAGVDLSAVPVADPGSPLAADWVHGAFAQIFVRSYQDSDGDGVGDLRGLISRLDYLRDLGVRGLWLLPIHRNQDGDHGYAVTNYRDIDPSYGSLADFDELLRQAHARGIGVVLDYVINHSAAQHPLFPVSAADSSNSFRSWYVWANPAPTGWNVFGGNPWRSTGNGAYYAPFWDQMPDWNLRNPEVLAFHHNNLRFWLNRGVDGFRVDAVGVLIENGASAWENQPESVSLMRDVRSLLDGYSRRFMVCEAPSAATSFAPACGRAFAFGTQFDLLGAARSSDTNALARLTQAPSAGLAPFLSNHDSFAGDRPFDQLGGDLPALKVAASLALLRPGPPFIYYGEEIGMNGGAGLSGDPRLRSPMSWTADATHAGFSTRAPYRALAANSRTHNVAAQLADPASLLTHYRTLLALRNAQPALSQGTLESGQVLGGVAAFWRVLGSERVLVAVNTARSATGSIALGGAPANASLIPLLGGGGGLSADAQGRINLNLPAQGTLVLKVSP